MQHHHTSNHTAAQPTATSATLSDMNEHYVMLSSSSSNTNDSVYNDDIPHHTLQSTSSSSPSITAISPTSLNIQNSVDHEFVHHPLSPDTMQHLNVHSIQHESESNTNISMTGLLSVNSAVPTHFNAHDVILPPISPYPYFLYPSPPPTIEHSTSPAPSGRMDIDHMDSIQPRARSTSPSFSLSPPVSHVSSCLSPSINPSSSCSSPLLRVPSFLQHMNHMNLDSRGEEDNTQGSNELRHANHFNTIHDTSFELPPDFVPVCPPPFPYSHISNAHPHCISPTFIQQQDEQNNYNNNFNMKLEGADDIHMRSPTLFSTPSPLPPLVHNPDDHKVQHAIQPARNKKSTFRSNVSSLSLPSAVNAPVVRATAIPVSKLNRGKRNRSNKKQRQQGSVTSNIQTNTRAATAASRSRTQPSSTSSSSSSPSSSPAPRKYMSSSTSSSPVPPNSCPYPDCHAYFSKPSALKRHIRCHTGERPFVCDACDAAFSERGNLKRHYLIHTGERKFICPYKDCGSRFSRSSHLQQHTIAIHSDDNANTHSSSSASPSTKLKRRRRSRKKGNGARVRESVPKRKQRTTNNTTASSTATPAIALPANHAAQSIAELQELRKKVMNIANMINDITTTHSRE